MLSAALDMQYSPRFVETTEADIDEMLTMQPLQVWSIDRCSIIQAAQACGKEIRPFQVCPHHFVEALFGCLEDVYPLTRSNTSVVDQHVQAPKLAPHGLNQLDVGRLRPHVGDHIKRSNA